MTTNTNDNLIEVLRDTIKAASGNGKAARQAAVRGLIEAMGFDPKEVTELHITRDGVDIRTYGESIHGQR